MQTAAVVSSFVLDKKFGFIQGFDSYDDEFNRSTSKYRLREWEGHEIKRGFDRPGDEVTARALQWLDEDRQPDKGFFLFLHYFESIYRSQPRPSRVGSGPYRVSIG